MFVFQIIETKREYFLLHRSVLHVFEIWRKPSCWCSSPCAALDVKFVKMPCEVGEKIYNRLLKCFQVILKIFIVCMCTDYTCYAEILQRRIQQMASFFDCFSLKINSRCGLSILTLTRVGMEMSYQAHRLLSILMKNNAPNRIFF
jgi:hypothetical protein